MDYRAFKAEVEKFKKLFGEAKSGYVEMVILDLIHEFSPNFMEYKAKEMIEEGDFDHDTAVRSHFKRLLWNEIVEESRREVAVFKTDEELIEELSSSSFIEKHPQFVPMPKNTEQEYEEHLRKIMETTVCHPCMDDPVPCHPHPHDS
jgi:hypothetical protein